MIINVKNLGIITYAEVDTSKPLIIMCGPNSTGKTYLSYLLYTIFSNSELMILYDAWVEEIIDKGVLTITLDNLNSYLRAEGGYIKRRLYNIFGLAPESNKSMFRSFDMTMTCTQEEYNEYFWSKKFERTFKVASVPWIMLKKAENTDCIQINFLIEKEDIKLRRLNISQLINTLLREYAHAPSAGTRMLTVERNSIYTFKTELSLSRSELIDKMLESSLSGNNIKEVLNKESSRYPLAIRDSLRIANDLENIQKKVGEYKNYAEKIERELLQGSIDVEKSTGAVEFTPYSTVKNPKPLPIHMASSIVKTLSSLILYLKHLAKANDLVIIDEPEMNMHPENQCVLARIFAGLVNKGLRMVISTHSDYIIREFNNLIMVEDQGNEYQPHEVKINIGSSISQVALYRFDEGEKGDFMPFFNSSHHKPKQAEDAPKGLRAFCDYILLVEKHGVTYVVLVEMKRGSSAGAEQQLEAGELFMNYVVRSADRIKDLNKMSNFNSKDITFRRVLLKMPVSPKQRTRPGFIRPEDRNGIIEYAVYANFYLNQVL